MCSYQHAGVKSLFLRTRSEYQVLYFPAMMPRMKQARNQNLDFNFKFCFLACFRGSSSADAKVKSVRANRGLTHYTCGICNELFEGRESYQIHLNSEHEGKSLKCDICPFTSNSAEKITSHMLGRHNIVAEV